MQSWFFNLSQALQAKKPTQQTSSGKGCDGREGFCRGFLNQLSCHNTTPSSACHSPTQSSDAAVVLGPVWKVVIKQEMVY
jgi:hypothetical protein